MVIEFKAMFDFEYRLIGKLIYCNKVQLISLDSLAVSLDLSLSNPHVAKME